MIKAAIEICWRSRPRRSIAPNVPRIVNSSMTPTSSAVRKPMKRYITTRIKSRPAIRFSKKPPMRRCTDRGKSFSTVMAATAGRSARIKASSFSTAWPRAVIFRPFRCVIETPTAGLPLTRMRSGGGSA